MPQLKKKNPFLLIAIPVFVIFFLIWTVTFNNAFSDPSGGSQTVLTEADFSQDPGITAAPNEDIIAVFLESPSTEGEENDTGGDGFDVIPYRYTDALEQTFCWQDSNQSAEHYMTLSDIDGNEIVTVTANGECVTELIEPGNYSMSLFHDGNAEKNVAVFIIPEGDKSIINTTTGEAAEDVATFLDTNKCVGCDLSGVNFNNANLSGVDLSDAILNDAILADADLSEADLSGAELINADLSRANLTGANLSGADLSGAILIEADLTNANLLQANLENADTTGADFSGAQTTGTLVAQTEATSGEENQASDLVSARAIPCTGDLPTGGTGEDLEVMGGTCTVKAGTFNYGNVNIYNNGILEFEDADIDFWAKSILVENGGSLIAGENSDAGAFGANGGTLTIHLYGSDMDKTGIECKTDAMCGVPSAIWTSNIPSVMNPPTCVKKVFSNGVNDCFYQYTPPDNITGETGFFGRKVLAVSYGGTLKLFGKKGAVFSELESSDSGKSWARLDGNLKKTATQLKVDSKVDWEVGDRIVVTTTDYLPGHSEVLEIVDPPVDKDPVTGLSTTFNFKVLDPYKGTEIPGGLQYDHNGKMYPLNGAPDRLGLKINAAETRAAVALLTRSIRIVSGGDGLGDPFPAPAPGKYYGGHVMARQGVKELQLQGVEFYQLGQGGRKGRYPVHFHLLREAPPNTYAKDNSVHDSMTRWYTLHGAHGVTLARNVGYMSIGHGYYIEDGTEINNKFHSNIGIFARGAIINKQNPRHVPGILAYTADKAATNIVPTHSDYAQPAVFWIMNGWNDFEYNMAAGANACGICYWWLPGAISGPSQKMKWEGYAAQQSNLARAGITPLKKFKGNYCSTAMSSFNTTADISPCLGVGGGGQALLEPVEVGNISPLPVGGEAETYYPKLGNLHRPTTCDINTEDCSTVPPCSAGTRERCTVSVIDSYATAFNWTETNFSAIWLRPQWYLVIHSVISDVLNAGLTFVTGGDYTESNFIPGQWQLARQNVFIGETQKDNDYASRSGPVNGGTTLTCENGPGGITINNYCLLRDEGISIPLTNFANNQRLFNVYDGPSFEDSNAFFNIKKTFIGDCNVGQGSCATSKSMYGRVPGMPKDTMSDSCILPNAAIAWKQSNGFYYPPAFHSSNLFFSDVDIRHFVIEPLFEKGPFAFKSDDERVKQNYCTFALNNPEGIGGLFQGFTAIDRQTILNDDDGSLTGLKNTISVNEDPFFNAPTETIECESEETAKTSPYDYVTTVVYPGCVAKKDCGGHCSLSKRPCADNSQCDIPVGPPPHDLCMDTDWTDDCGSSFCYGVPLYRQFLTKDEEHSTKGQEIRMMGMNFFQRSNLTANKGLYYIDTTVSKQSQKAGLLLSPGQNPSLNVFKGGETYYVLLIFAKETTKQTYLFYVGDGFDPDTHVKKISSSLKSTRPLDVVTDENNWPAKWERKWYMDDPTTGIVEVTIDLSDYSTEFANSKMDRCKPQGFCEWSGSAEAGKCECSTELITTNPDMTMNTERYDECVKPLGENQNTICDWAVRAVDCPEGGCLGFSFTLSDDYDSQPKNLDPPEPMCYPPPPDNQDWNVKFVRATNGPPLGNIAGTCADTPAPAPKFCKGFESPPPNPPDEQPEPTEPPTSPPGGGTDTDNDGVPDAIDADSDNDGIPDNMEMATNGTSSLTSTRMEIPADPDGDGIPNELDLDSDGDGLLDHFEGGGNNDANMDGMADNFTDSDGDGLHDAHDPDQGGDVLPLPDTDGDGVPDFLDSVNDSDDGGDDGDNAEGSGSDSSSSCAIAGQSGVKGGLAGLLVYALIPAGVLLRRRLRGRK